MPLSDVWDFLIHNTATLPSKDISLFPELKICLLSLYQLMDSGCDPDTWPSSFTNLPSVSSKCSGGFLVKVGGIFRSENKTYSLSYKTLKIHRRAYLSQIFRWNVSIFRSHYKHSKCTGQSNLICTRHNHFPSEWI